MPDRAHRLDDLLKYARATYPEVAKVETIQAACEAAVDATRGYSLRGYYTFGVHEERAAVPRGRPFFRERRTERLNERHRISVMVRKQFKKK